MKKILVLQNVLFKVRILPSWLILVIDLILFSAASLFTYYFFTKLGIEFHKTLNYTSRFTISFVIYLFYFLVFKTYTGIIRYSTLNDMLRIFKAVLLSFLTIVAVNFGHYYIFGKEIFIIFTVFCTSFFVFFSLVGLRLLVKILFTKITLSYRDEKDNIAIIGVNPQNISLVETLTNPSSSFNLICFIDSNSTLDGKKVAGINIISPKSKSIFNFIKNKEIKNIILTKGYFEEDVEVDLIENCIKNNIKVYKPELLENFNNKNFDNLKSYNLEELLFRDSININNPKIIDKFKDKTILITGGAGSIGSELSKQLCQFQPKKLIIVDNAETPLYEIEMFFKKNNCDINIYFELVDVTNYKELESVFTQFKPEIIFHAAAYKHVPLLEKNYKQAIKVNIFGTKNCLDLAMKYEVENFVFVSTDKAVNPTNIMGASKRFAEMLCQSSFHLKKNKTNTQIMVTRFGNVLGSNGSVVKLFKEQILEGGPVTVTHPEVNRFFMTIPEACKLVIEAGAMGQGGQVYLFDMGKSIKILDLAKKMIYLSGKIPNKDIPIIFTGLREGEKLYEETLTESAKTLPTYNPKIVIAKEDLPCSETLDEIYSNLKRINEMHKNELSELLRIIIPGFNPNSIN